MCLTLQTSLKSKLALDATARRLVQIAFDFTPKPTSFHRGAKSANESCAAETSTAFESSTTRGQVVRPRFERSTIFPQGKDMSKRASRKTTLLYKEQRPNLSVPAANPANLLHVYVSINA